MLTVRQRFSLAVLVAVHLAAGQIWHRSANAVADRGKAAATATVIAGTAVALVLVHETVRITEGTGKETGETDIVNAIAIAIATVVATVTVTGAGTN